MAVMFGPGAMSFLGFELDDGKALTVFSDIDFSRYKARHGRRFHAQLTGQLEIGLGIFRPQPGAEDGDDHGVTAVRRPSQPSTSSPSGTPWRRHSGPACRLRHDPACSASWGISDRDR